MVAHRPSKPFVAGSNPVSRFPRFCSDGEPELPKKKFLTPSGTFAVAMPVNEHAVTHWVHVCLMSSSLVGEPCRIRTCDTLLKRQVLCQLS